MANKQKEELKEYAKPYAQKNADRNAVHQRVRSILGQEETKKQAERNTTQKYLDREDQKNELKTFAGMVKIFNDYKNSNK